MPIFKKQDPIDKTNDRPLSILLTVSKIFETLFNQLRFSSKFLLPLLCEIRKGYSTQYAPINLQKWQNCLDASDGIVGTLLMDLSKVYDCLIQP